MPTVDAVPVLGTTGQAQQRMQPGGVVSLGAMPTVDAAAVLGGEGQAQQRQQPGGDNTRGTNPAIMAMPFEYHTPLDARMEDRSSLVPFQRNAAAAPPAAPTPSTAGGAPVVPLSGGSLGHAPPAAPQRPAPPPAGAPVALLCGAHPGLRAFYPPSKICGGQDLYPAGFRLRRGASAPGGACPSDVLYSAREVINAVTKALGKTPRSDCVNAALHRVQLFGESAVRPPCSTHGWNKGCAVSACGDARATGTRVLLTACGVRMLILQVVTTRAEVLAKFTALGDAAAPLLDVVWAHAAPSEWPFPLPPYVAPQGNALAKKARTGATAPKP
ncbi:hypothetical protein T484DRAFT_1763628 [Baffinella frigidus]|nr:hypothetical protein T484DRAFT_1763628 [Cryptophyta sp. CCMP2293]